MSHTFLIKSGRWIAGGTYFDESGKSIEAEGTTEIKHESIIWTISGTMKLKTTPSATFQNVYRIKPLKEGEECTEWNSDNPMIGTLVGRFTIVDDSIISIFSTEDGSYSGSEFLIRVSDTKYINRGYLMHKDKKISSWSLELRKE